MSEYPALLRILHIGGEYAYVNINRIQAVNISKDVYTVSMYDGSLYDVTDTESQKRILKFCNTYNIAKQEQQ